MEGNASVARFRNIRERIVHPGCLLLVHQLEGNEFHVGRDIHFFLLRVPTLAKYRNVCHVTTGKNVLEIKGFDLRKREWLPAAPRKFVRAFSQEQKGMHRFYRRIKIPGSAMS